MNNANHLNRGRSSLFSQPNSCSVNPGASLVQTDNMRTNDAFHRTEFLLEEGSDPLRRRVTIETLPNDILLEIFSSYLQLPYEDEWITLAHVCRRWRHVLSGSPRGLNLRLVCTRYRSVSEMLGVWPDLPVDIIWENYPIKSQMGNMDNVGAALEHNERINKINFHYMPSFLIEGYVALMRVPFPALKSLELFSSDETATVLPDSLLGGSAPHLQSLNLNGVLFPALPNLLLTTTDLVELSLYRIPHSGYISPEKLVTYLSSLVSLESLELGFLSPQSRPDRTLAVRRPHPLIRTVLPALKLLYFTGMSEYLEDLVSRIDTLFLNDIHISFINQHIFDTPHIRQFFGRTQQFVSPKQAKILFHEFIVEVALSPPTTVIEGNREGLTFDISCRGLDRQLSSVARVCSTYLPLSTLEHLCIHPRLSYPQLHIPFDIEHAQWLELFHPFTAVKNLYLTEQMNPFVVPALRELTGERAIEVLPALQTIFLGGTQQTRPTQEAMMPFISARQRFGRPVVVRHWKGDWWDFPEEDDG